MLSEWLHGRESQEGNDACSTSVQLSLIELLCIADLLNHFYLLVNCYAIQTKSET